MEIGTMDKRITISRIGFERDAGGGSAEIRTPMGTFWAEVSNLGNRLIRSARQNITQDQRDFRIRFYSQVQKNDIITYGDGDYRITGIDTVEEKNRYQILTGERIGVNRIGS